MRKWKTSEFIIKPNIGANADDTYRISVNKWHHYKQELMPVFKDRLFMIQPFLQDIIETGEFSLFYFNHTYSHTILKTPKRGDFRVQEEHGGQLKRVQPPEILLDLSEKTLSFINEPLLYARLDFAKLPGDTNRYGLMEAELIEPSLYFNMDGRAALRFTKAFIELIER